MADDFVSYDAYQKLEQQLKQAQQQIEQLQFEKDEAIKQYDDMLEGTGDSLFVIDASDGYKIIEVNSHAARRLGYQDDELIGIPINQIEVSSPLFFDDSHFWESTYSGTFIYECFYRHKEGQLIPVEVSGRKVAIQDRVIVHNVVRNIEARVQAQQQKIDQAIEQTRSAILSAFIENASHEFRTPLTLIGTQIYLMSLSNDPQERQRMRSTMQLKLDQIDKLLDMLLLRVKVDTITPSDFTPLDLIAIVKPLCEDLQNTTHNKPEQSFQFMKNLPKISGHSEYLTIAIQQVLDNAVRYTPPDGKIEIVIHGEGDDVYLDIRDTGVGISDENIPHIFEAFWREDTAHTTAGLGLGLSITNQIIRRHQGRIKVTSQLNVGTHFQIILPCIPNSKRT